MTLEQALAELRDPDPQARVRAVRWLRVLGGPEAVAALIGALDDPFEDVFASAGLALGEMQVREAVPILIERVRSDRRWEERAFSLLGSEIKTKKTPQGASGETPCLRSVCPERRAQVP